jgi:hypothetical protein
MGVEQEAAFQQALKEQFDNIMARRPLHPWMPCVLRRFSCPLALQPRSDSSCASNLPARERRSLYATWTSATPTPLWLTTSG